MTISIILSTYNWHTALHLILSSLESLVKNHTGVEIIIADDGSTIETTQVIKEFQSRITNLKHLWHADTGFKKAEILNKAVAESTGEYLIFLDGDCIPFPDFISQHIKLAEANYFIAGNRILLNQTMTHQLLGAHLPLEEVFAWKLVDWYRAKKIGGVNKILANMRFSTNWWRYLRKANWKYPKGCNFAVWRKDFYAVNGFDELFNGWGHEDADIFIRLLHNGISIKDGRFAIPVLHLWHKESSRDNERSNWKRLNQRLQDKSITQAVKGISTPRV